MTAIESEILPYYKSVIEGERLVQSREEKEALTCLIAFQMVRTKDQRQLFSDLHNKMGQKFQEIDSSLNDQFTPMSEEELKIQHINFIRESLPGFASSLMSKDIVLIKANEGESFYISDNPVVMYNLRPSGAYSNIGLSVRGIEVYLPLTSKLLIAAWCPSILHEIREGYKAHRRNMASVILGASGCTRARGPNIDRELASLRAPSHRIERLLERTEAGLPLESDAENMKHFNSLQVSFANEFIICERGNFGIARDFMNTYPGKLQSRIDFV